MRFLRYLGAFAVLLLLVWGLATISLYLIMQQPPETFGAVMKHVPPVAMLVLPFKPLWDSARGGKLEIGDLAPDFELPDLHNERTVRLSDEYRQKPVVLVFGSYT